MTRQHKYSMLILSRDAFQTPIEYDMNGGKGFNTDYGRDFAIDIIKQRRPQEFYDHRTPKFTTLHN